MWKYRENFLTYAWGPLAKLSFSAQRELGAHIWWKARLIWCLETCERVFHDTQYFRSIRGRFFSGPTRKCHLDFPLVSYCFPIEILKQIWPAEREIREISTKNLVTFASGGVRRSSWALECVEFHGGSISGTPGTIPRDPGAPISKKPIFPTFFELCGILGFNNPGPHCKPLHEPRVRV